MRRFIGLLAGLVLAFACAAAVHAHDYTVGDLQIMHPWAKPSLKGAPNGAAYMAISNTGESGDVLLSVSSGVAEAVELHTMEMTDGVMRMRPIEGGIKVPAGETVALEPGGLHVMLIGLKRALKDGDTMELELTFAQAGDITVEAAIEQPTGRDSIETHQH